MDQNSSEYSCTSSKACSENTERGLILYFKIFSEFISENPKKMLGCI